MAVSDLEADGVFEMKLIAIALLAALMVMSIPSPNGDIGMNPCNPQFQKC